MPVPSFTKRPRPQEPAQLSAMSLDSSRSADLPGQNGRRVRRRVYQEPRPNCELPTWNPALLYPKPHGMPASSAVPIGSEGLQSSPLSPPSLSELVKNNHAGLARPLASKQHSETKAPAAGFEILHLCRHGVAWACRCTRKAASTGRSRNCRHLISANASSAELAFRHELACLAPSFAASADFAIPHPLFRAPSRTQ